MAEVTLHLDGREYSGWTEVSVLRGIDSIVGNFQLSLTERARTGAEKWPLRAGADCTVAIDGDQLIAGRIDRLSGSIEGSQHVIRVTGRDKAADLVDASAIHKPGSWSNVAMDRIVDELVAPFGIAVDFVGDPGKPIRRFAIQPGETVWSAIERLARFRALLAFSRADGSVYIGPPSNDPPLGTIEEGVNLLVGDGEHDVSDRFSEYVVRGQAHGDDENNGRVVSAVSAKATDPAIARHRPLLIVAEEQGGKAELQKRADWEANVRAARGQTFTATMQGWTMDGVQLWRPNRKVTFRAPSLWVDAEMLIVSTEFVRSSDQGTTTRLRLQPRQAWTELPTSEDGSEL